MNILYLLFPLVPTIQAAEGVTTSNEKSTDKTSASTVKKTTKAQKPAAQAIGYPSHSFVTSNKNDVGYSDFEDEDESEGRNIGVSIGGGFTQSNPFAISSISTDVKYSTKEEDRNYTLPTSESVTTVGSKYGNKIKNGTNSSGSSKSDDEVSGSGSGSTTTSGSEPTTTYSITKGFKPYIGITAEAKGESMSGGIKGFVAFSKGSVGQAIDVEVDGSNTKLKVGHDDGSEMDMSGKKIRCEVTQEHTKPEFGTELFVKKNLSGDDDSKFRTSLSGNIRASYIPSNSVEITIKEHKSDAPVDGTSQVMQSVAGKYKNDKGMIVPSIGVGLGAEIKVSDSITLNGGVDISYKKMLSSEAEFTREDNKEDSLPEGIDSAKSKLKAAVSGPSVSANIGLSFNI